MVEERSIGDVSQFVIEHGIGVGRADDRATGAGTGQNDAPAQVVIDLAAAYRRVRRVEDINPGVPGLPGSVAIRGVALDQVPIAGASQFDAVDLVVGDQVRGGGRGTADRVVTPPVWTSTPLLMLPRAAVPAAFVPI